MIYNDGGKLQLYDTGWPGDYAPRPYGVDMIKYVKPETIKYFYYIKY
jgi:hypothetical protein